MTLFVVAFLVIAALVLLLWLFVRPLADELGHLSGRSVAPPSSAQKIGPDAPMSKADADASGSSLVAAVERQRRAGEGIGRSLESG
jgi:hypothetical protein